MLATGHAGHLNPTKWPLLALGGYVFPVFLIATVLFMLFWLFFKKRFILISFIALIAAYGPTTLYCPVAWGKNTDETGKNRLKVLTYNTCNWGKGSGGATDREDFTHMLEYLHSQKADVMCLQESAPSRQISELFDSIFSDGPRYHMDTICSPVSGGLTITLISRFPIKRKQRIDIQSKGNNAAAFWVEIPQEKGGGKPVTLCIVNCHLETMGMSVKEKDEFSTAMHSMAHGKAEKDSLRSLSHHLIGKISAASQIRAPQADIVSDFIARQMTEHPEMPLLVCGDFNDIPQSYTHYRIQHPQRLDTKGAADITPLIDCYQESATGPGYTIYQNAMRVRIDNILCSQQFTPIHTMTDRSVRMSDHFPVIALLEIYR